MVPGLTGQPTVFELLPPSHEVAAASILLLDFNRPPDPAFAKLPRVGNRMVCRARISSGGNTMKPLKFYPVTSVDELASPGEGKKLTLNSPALDFFTDFKATQPLVIDDSISAVVAKSLMQKTHVRLKFVLDEKGCFVGIISADDLIDRELVKKVSMGIPREQIAVTEMMTPKHLLKALDYSALTTATIADVIAALKDSGEQHCLVIDQEDHRIRGIFSASDISRSLHLPINIQEKSSFYRVFSTTV